MNIDMWISRAARRGFLASSLLAASLAWAANPIDPVSNPKRLDYPEVHMTLPDYDEPFQRTGIMEQPELFRKVAPGMTSGQVAALLGQPLNGGEATQSRLWDYNFTFRLPRSQNYIVCQYKVVFDQESRVENAYWRRHQCLDIVKGAAG